MRKPDMVWSKFFFSLSSYFQGGSDSLAAWLAQVKLGSFQLKTVPRLKGNAVYVPAGSRISQILWQKKI